MQVGDQQHLKGFSNFSNFKTVSIQFSLEGICII